METTTEDESGAGAGPCDREDCKALRLENEALKERVRDLEEALAGVGREFIRVHYYHFL